MSQHPDFAAEAARVRHTAARAAQEWASACQREQSQRQELEILVKTGGGENLYELMIADRLLAMIHQAATHLGHARYKPYFTRVDFTDSQPHQYYIGKWGLTDPDTQTPYVIDWRSPVADLYYTGQVGPAGYDTPGGRVEGEMTLKRILTCADGELVSLLDADIITQDEYLSSILSDHADNRLRDIVTTIQAEQNVILRHDRRRPMVVQGVAGAGKTTVALHRLTWLLYTYQDTMTPANLMVIAPNPLFLNYISAVLPELGVEDVLQTTVAGLCERLCGKKLPPIADAATLLSLLDPAVPQAQRDRLARVSRLKASLAFKACIEAYCASLAGQLPPPGDVEMGPVRLYTRAELQEVYGQALNPFPLEPRKKELRKHMSERLRSACETYLAQAQYAVEQQANFLREDPSLQPEERRAQMAALYAGRDAQRAELDALRKTFLKDYFKAWPKVDLLGLYRAFLNPQPCFSLPEGVSNELWRDVCEVSLATLDSRRLDYGDLAALLVLQKAVWGYAQRLDIHHTVIDEAQDLSPFLFFLLQDIAHNASFTIVGDLDQGIHGYRGVTDWRAMMAEVFPGDRADYFELVTSYRNTVEIMEFAGRVSARHAPPGHKTAQPVLRHGSAPQLLPLPDHGATAALAQEVQRLLDLGCVTVAVVDLLPAACKKLQAALARQLDVPVRLLTDADIEYTGGVMVLPAHLTKGLEFDAVILADVGADVWPDDALHARLLYVCLTRPLHHLTCYYRGTPTTLLEALP